MSRQAQTSAEKNKQKIITIKKRKNLTKKHNYCFFFEFFHYTIVFLQICIGIFRLYWNFGLAIIFIASLKKLPRKEIPTEFNKGNVKQ